MMRQLGRALSRRRRYPLAQWVMKGFEEAVRGYKNLDYNPARNGEYWFVRRLALHNPQVIFDVGANIGDWSLYCAQMCPTARIHAFEILPDVAARLRQNVAAFPRVRVNDVGLFSDNTTLDVTVFGKDGDQSNVLGVPWTNGGTTVAAKAIRGDDYMDDNAIDLVDFMKIDAEGVEHQILEGFSRTLEQGRIKIIQFEYGRNNIYSGYLLKDMYEMLNSYGYDVGKLYSNFVDFKEYSSFDEDFIGVNFIAYHRAFLKDRNIVSHGVA